MSLDQQHADGDEMFFAMVASYFPEDSGPNGKEQCDLTTTPTPTEHYLPGGGTDPGGQHLSAGFSAGGGGTRGRRQLEDKD